MFFVVDKLVCLRSHHVYHGDNKGLKRSVCRVYNSSLQMIFGKCTYKSQKS